MSGGPGELGAARIGAVITAYQPDDALAALCEAVVRQVDAVVVVDDGSPEPDERVLDRCRASGAVVLRHRTNLGVGAALNTGVRWVLTHLDGDDVYVLTLDQDSMPPAGYVAALLVAAAEARASGVLVGMVGPGRTGRVRPAAGRRTGGVVLSREPIQSGLLVPRATFDRFGLFAEKLFIDGVDTEFYLRAATRGAAAIVAPGLRLEHQLGRVHEVRLPGPVGPDVIPLVHAQPYRYYYIARNRVLLVRRYWRRAPSWAFTAILRDVRHLLLTTALVPGRRARLSHTVAGLRDGIRGVVGRRPGQRP